MDPYDILQAHTGDQQTLGKQQRLNFLTQFIQNSREFDAKITVEATDPSDRYQIDVYQDGYANDPTILDIEAYILYPSDKFKVGELVRVKYTSDGYCLIVPKQPMLAILKVTSAVSGKGAWYNGRLLIGTFTGDALTNLTMPEGMTVPGADDSLIFNVGENGLTTHVIANNSYILGFYVYTDTNSKKIFAGIGPGNSLPIPSARYQVLQCSAYTSSTNYTLAFDYVRAHS